MKRPSEMRYYELLFPADNPSVGLDMLITRLETLRKALRECPENYLNDYFRVAEILFKSHGDLDRVADAYMKYECGGVETVSNKVE